VVAEVAAGFLLWMALTTEAAAQSCANYAPVTRTTGITYNSIFGSSPSYFTWRNTASNQNDDNRSYQAPIGFDFYYLGVRYTQFSANLNGTVDFSASASDGNNGGTGPYGPNYNHLFSTAGNTNLALAPLYADLWTADSEAVPIATCLAYMVTGSAPNRVLTVEWLNFDEWDVPINSPAYSINMQVKIYESTGVIRFVYGTMTTGTVHGSYPLSYTCGINGTISGAPTAATLLTQQTANTTNFNSTPQDALNALPASNSMLTFTPPAPSAAPTGLNFTGVSKSGMTLNWTDNANNEDGYVIYNSTDNINFTFVSQVAAGSTSAPVAGLLSNTMYYWKVYAVTEGALSSPLPGSKATLPGTTFTSIHNTGWGTASTWDKSAVPGPGDTVIIANGTTVSVDGLDSCKFLTVGQGTSGQLTIGNSGVARTLTIGADLTVNAGATMTIGATAATHTMTIGANVVNNGTLNLAPAANRVCDVTFNKNGNQTISGTGATTNFDKITLNMGTSVANVLEVASTNFSVTPTNFLTLTNGMFKLSTAATITPFTGAVTIPLSAGLWVNNAGATVSMTGGTITLYGTLHATAGKVNIGTASDQNLTSYGGTEIIDGGTVDIAGRCDNAGTTVLTYFTMSSGTLVIDTVGSTTAGIAPFNITEVGSTFNMSGGTIIIRRPGNANLGYVNTGGTNGTVNGGIVQVGDASTPATQTMQINSSITVPNLVVSNGIAVTAQLVTNPLTVYGGVTTNSGTFNSNALNISLGGNWANNGGSFLPTTATVTFTGNSSAINGTAAAQTFNNIVVNKTTGQTESVGGSTTSLTVNGTFTETAGNFTAPATMTVGGTATLSSGTFTAGTSLSVAGDWINNGGTLSAGGGTTVTLNGTVAEAIGGSTPTIFNNLTLANTSASVSGNTNFNVAGTMTVNASALFTPGAAVVINNAAAAGTITGSGTVQVTRTVATADYLNQYKFLTNTLSSLTVDYSAGGAQTVDALNYSNLTISGTRTTNSVTLAPSGTVGIAGVFNMTATFTSGGYITTGSTVNFNGSGAQTIPAFNYYNLTTSGARTTFSITLAPAGTIGIAGAFNPTATFTSGGYVITGSTIDFNGAAQNVPAFNGATGYNNLNLSGAAGTKTAAGNIVVSGNFDNGGGSNNAVTFSVGTNTLTITGTKDNTNALIQFAGAANAIVFNTGTVEYNGTVAQTVTPGTYNNIIFSNTGAKNVNASTTANGYVAIATGTPVTVAVGVTVQVNGTLTHGGAITNNGIINVGP
jgi:hypothetical protein